MIDMAELLAEKKRLDALLDDALDQYALYEEGMNIRFKSANETERTALMAERNEVEDKLGIVALVLRLDEIREMMEQAAKNPAA
ncbi:hypothetical protein MSR1_28460 [Magnetospirillum gryphiswaldense MSR-1]|uniref:Uncharacterized protein n=2 Tax=Magnetospirillum gryphiswaldense TaxID=55518 RepID=V6F4F7_MAGGM|nr:hypothetical protein MSR1_28460 [Magnetospirillum gryphiswaldense MSR-1]AVM79217.1 hypothetical protein MSR1L_28460 [Magnetospirillum gryphiswaldense]CDL00329.1 conserved protein of unknown function [Magnetospirillum gryphiswaldense MSR-1 v2]